MFWLQLNGRPCRDWFFPYECHENCSLWVPKLRGPDWRPCRPVYSPLCCRLLAVNNFTFFVVSDNQLLLFLGAPTNLLVLTYKNAYRLHVLGLAIMLCSCSLVQWLQISEPHCALANLSAVRFLCWVSPAQGCGGSHLHFRRHTNGGTRTISNASVISVDVPLKASSSHQKWLLCNESCRFPQLLSWEINLEQQWRRNGQECLWSVNVSFVT